MGFRLRQRRRRPRAAAHPCCPICARRHPERPLVYASDAPAAWGDGPVRRDDWELGEDQCVIGDACYLRGQLLIPVDGLLEPLVWGVWAELDRALFDRTAALWTTPGRESEPPYPARLATELPAELYGPTLGMPVHLRTQPVGIRPLVEVADPAHPLAREQRDGIPAARLAVIAELVLHGVAPGR